MPDFDALLILNGATLAAAAFLAMRGHLSVQLRRRPEPRKNSKNATAPGES